MSTLYDKIYALHVIEKDLIYVDRHLVHEVTSPQAFAGLKTAKRVVRRPLLALATADHNVSTSKSRYTDQGSSNVQVSDSIKESQTQCDTLSENVTRSKITFHGLGDHRQGIVHIIAPELAFTLPGTTVVCGDSHTSTHGAFGALAFGIGTSDVEHVLATQTVRIRKAANMLARYTGVLAEGVTAKDLVLHTIGLIGTAGGTGHVIEFAGTPIESMSMESRMTICNMAIEAGARAGLIAPDATTFAYLQHRPYAPSPSLWPIAVKHWSSLKSDVEAVFDKTVVINASEILPTVTWGTSPQDTCDILGNIPDPQLFPEPRRSEMINSLKYMALTPSTPISGVCIDKVFIGSCTNARIEDLRSVARIVAGRKVDSRVYAMIVPGSGIVKKQAEAEGLDRIFVDAGFDWREPGCSMCLGMNEDQLKPFERCASTSNRNFEGRQGAKGRTHLMSPAMAAAAAIMGHICDVRELVKVSTGRQVVLIECTDSKNYIDGRAANVENSLAAAVDSLGSNEAGENAGMPKFLVLEGVAAPMPSANIDTDQIIPKQFLKTITRTGLGTALFHSQRTSRENPPKESFILDQHLFQNSKFIVSGENFGCGSSREHAAWALKDFGIMCVIAPSFAEIFESNMLKNGMLTLTFPDQVIAELAKFAKLGNSFKVNLGAQTLTISTSNPVEIVAEHKFSVPEVAKKSLMEGRDAIADTLELEMLISDFEVNRSREFPWLDISGSVVNAHSVGLDMKW